MSFVFDTLQRAVETMPDDDIKTHVRWIIDRLHEISHNNQDFLNHDRRLVMEATNLSQVLDKKQAKSRE